MEENQRGVNKMDIFTFMAVVFIFLIVIPISVFLSTLLIFSVINGAQKVRDEEAYERLTKK